MANQFTRLEMLIGSRNLDLLETKKVAIFGVGGVGGNAVDSLARSGVKNFVLIDNDDVSLTNINRQYFADLSTVGKAKVDVAEEHILSISKDANITKIKQFIDPVNILDFDFSDIDYVVDAIDSIASKVALIARVKELNIPIISALGCGNRMDPTKLVVTDIYKTEGDPLAKILRKELREKGIKKHKVVYSTELPIKVDQEIMNACLKEEGTTKKNIPGSSSFVPPVAGIIMASEVVKDLLQNRKFIKIGEF